MRTTTLLAAFFACGAMAFMAGCGGEGRRTDTSQDSGGSTPQDSGGAASDCGTILDCSYECPEESWETCEQSCMSQADEGTKQLYTAVMDCEDAAWESSCSTLCEGNDEAACDNCFISACGEQYRVCYGLPSATPGSCAEILNCTFLCSEDGYETCAQGCTSQGNANAQQLFTALDECWNTAYAGSCSSACAGTDEDACDDCLDSACDAQLSACEDDA